MNVTLEIDAIGQLCPWPVLKAQKALRDLAPGAVICVTATDGMARIDLPHFCNQSGHEMLEMRADGDVTRYFIRKAGAAV